MQLIIVFRYSSQCRLILICNSPSKIIEPLRSRCLGIRVPAPTNEVISDILMDTIAKDSGNACTCPRELAMKISIHSERNLRRALFMLETLKIQHTAQSSASSSLPPDCVIPLPDWENYIIRLSREILMEQSPTKLLQARDMLYELLTNCIPADVIIQTITRELLKVFDDQLKHELVYWAAYYEHRVRLGSKEIFHLEAFIAKIMAIYKKFIVTWFS